MKSTNKNKVFNIEEHLHCRNYDNGDRPLVDLIKIEKGEKYSLNSIQPKILMTIKGNLNYSYGQYIDIFVSQKKILLLPSGYDCILESKDGCELICLRLNNYRQLCDRFLLEELLAYDNKEIDSDTPYLLKFNPQTESFATGLLNFIADKVRCYYFHELKMKEFSFVLRLYYEKIELIKFFKPLITNDVGFSEIVIRSIEKARSVKYLADETGYSISGFNKRFQKVFKTSPYKWLQARKAEKVFQALNKSDRPLKVIADEEGFSSLSELNKFCRAHYNETPGRIRSQAKHRVLEDI